MKEEGPDSPSRRKVLIGLGATAAAAAGGALYFRRESADTRGKRSPDTLKPHERGDMEQEFDESFLDIKKEPKSYEMGRLAGVKVKNLLSAYTVGSIEDEKERQLGFQEQIDFRYQLAGLWRFKLKYVKRNYPDFYPSVYSATKALFDSYNLQTATKTTLLQYRERADRSISEVRGDLDLARITSLLAFKKLDTAQMELLHKFEENIHGKALIAYALTEIMPTKGLDSKVGVETLDFLLRSAGVEFIDRIPAVHDKRVSVGAYQFTSDALYEIGREKHGASLMHSLTNKKNHIPGSVVQLKGDAHHKAAYLFALYNLAMLV